MNKNTTNTKRLDQFKDKYFGELGTASREELEADYQDFKSNFIKNISILKTKIQTNQNEHTNTRKTH